MRGYFRVVLTISALLLVNWLPLVQPPVAHAAASIYFSPSSIKLNVGQTATVTLYVSSSDQAINSAGGTIVLPENYVTPVSVSKAGSILTTFPEEPTISGTTIGFSGGLPTPGYTGSSGKLLSFSIKGKAEGTGLITLSGGKVLANDGKGTNIISGSASATVTVSQAISGATVTSSTHPNQANWYNQKNAAVSWSKPAGASSFTYTLSHDGGQPSQAQSATTVQAANFQNLAEGVWTFSLTTQFSSGKSANSTYTIRIDTTPPQPFTATVKQVNGQTDPFPVLEFTATDTPSGIDHYEIVVDSEGAITTSDTSYKLPRQRPGKHRFTVRAIDKAGNTAESTGDFEVTGFPGPTITDFPKFLSILQPVTLRGQAYYGTTVKLFIDDKEVDQFVVKDNLSEHQRALVTAEALSDDSLVEWVFTYKGLLLPGTHKIYAIQVRPDTSESNPSNEISTRVLASSITLGSITIPMALVVAMLLAVIIGLIFLVLWIYRRGRDGISDWSKRLHLLKEEVDNEMEHLEDRVEEDVDQSVEKSRALRHDVTNEIEKAQTAIDQSIDAIIKNRGDNHDKTSHTS